MTDPNQPLVEMIAVADLVPDPRNPRTISRTEFDSLVRNIEEFGMVQPLVCNRRNMQIVGGHQRAQAARQLKLTTVPVVWVDLDPGKQTALNLSLNRIAGEFDDQMLAELIVDLDDDLLSLTGFTDTELDALTADPFDEEEPEKETTKVKKYSLEELKELAKSKWPKQPVILEFLEWVSDAEH